jgi:hypothetical protein
MTERKPTAPGKARAAAIHAEIDKLTGVTRTPPEGEDPAGKKPTSSPRDFIQKWMAEHDKKPEDK